MTESSTVSSFLLNMTGEIQSAEYLSVDSIYCKYCFSYGNDWQIANGIENGISQITKKSIDQPNLFVWNFPLDITFKSTNVFGWPELVVSVYGCDYFGNDIVMGYGGVHIPCVPGINHRKIPLFVPESSSLIHKLSSYFTGQRPEFVNSKIVAQSQGRELITVKSLGYVNVKFNIILKDFKKYGFRA